MAVEFCDLHALRNGKDLFCFSKARRNLLSTFADKCLNVTPFLGIEFLLCNEEESDIYLKFIPSQFGTLWLKSVQNLSRLHEALLNSSERECTSPNFRCKFPFVEDNCSMSFFPDTECTPWHFLSIP